MKNAKDWLNEIKAKISSEYKEVSSIPNRNATGHKTWGNNWATVVSIDIVGSKKFLEKHKREYGVKAIQSFMHGLSSIAKDPMFSNSFRDIYFAGDEVIVVFDASTRGSISEGMNFALYANSFSNYVLNKALKDSKYIGDFKAGIGVWTSNDNSLVLSGHKGSQDDVITTLIGSAINNASALAKIANRGNGYNQKEAIMINNTTRANLLGDVNDSVVKWMKHSGSHGGENIYAGGIYKVGWDV